MKGSPREQRVLALQIAPLLWQALFSIPRLEHHQSSLWASAVWVRQLFWERLPFLLQPWLDLPSFGILVTNDADSFTWAFARAGIGARALATHR